MTVTPLDRYPDDYRAAEVRAIAAAAQAGECVSVIGLSGAGKSNLLRFLAERQPVPGVRCVLVDANRLPEPTAAALFALIGRLLGAPETPADPVTALDLALDAALRAGPLCLLLDRFDLLVASAPPALFNNLRALRDAHKFRLSYVVATRRPLPAQNELAELFHAHTLWLGPLAPSDALWNVRRYAARKGLAWDDATAQAIVAATWGYPGLLRAACEAYAAGAALDALAAHPAVQARVAEFWSDGPGDDDLARAGLRGQPLLLPAAPAPAVDPAHLTAKEEKLLRYLQEHAGDVCTKDELIRAVWPEDRVYEEGVRDDSLAQLVRRLREKIEPEPHAPRYIVTVVARGYRYRKGSPR